MAHTLPSRDRKHILGPGVATAWFKDTDQFGIEGNLT